MEHTVRPSAPPDESGLASKEGNRPCINFKKNPLILIEAKEANRFSYFIYNSQIISVLALIIGLSLETRSQNPHGENLIIDCAACHSPEGWEISKSAWDNGTLVIPTSEETFNHDNTAFPLTGQHESLDCRDCHDNLVFEEAQSSCISCHTDLHQMTVGDDCVRCHNTEHWLVDNIAELHQENGFPLLGNHALTSCYDCHISETAVRFDRIGNDCINCHLDEYMVTTMPDHQAANYSLECMDCHDVASPDWQWSSGGAGHLFFPLTKGHAIDDCAACHVNEDFSNTPTECSACHLQDFQQTTDPDHEAAGFPTDCALCHTTETGWPTDDFTEHDNLYFPIYSGTHQGEWNECTECHTIAGDFSSFSCIDCHEHDDPNDLADEHDEVPNYSYNSLACYECHPKGEK